ncbi:MAG: ABC transporter permease [Clostridiales bacterium]
MDKKGLYIYPLLTLLILAIFWQIFVSTGGISPWLLPSPLQIISSLGENWSLLWVNAFYTLFEALLGLSIAIIFALCLALLMTIFPVLKKSLYPILVGSQMVPIIVLAPLFLIWFGYGILPKILVVILICFFPMVINILMGLDSLDRDMLLFYSSMGAKPWALFRLIRLPAALPYFFSGLRISATYSIMGAVIGEWLGAAKGIGLLLTRAQRAFDLPLVFAAITVIIILSTLAFFLVYLAERFFLKWQYTTGKTDS